MEQLKIRRGGRVRRWHTVDVHREQTVAEHSWGVSCIILDLWPDCSKELLKAALWHDVGEYVTGDIPVTAKWKYEQLSLALERAEGIELAEMGLGNKLTEEEKCRLKIADMMELLFYCVEEMQMGNKFTEPVFDRGIEYIYSLGVEGGGPLKMIEELIDKRKSL